MARRSRTTMLKRLREAKKAEKAAQKRARRHGIAPGVRAEPQPTIDIGALVRGEYAPAEGEEPRDGEEEEPDGDDE